MPNEASLPSIIIIVSWQRLPCATLILLAAIQSLDGEQLEAVEMDGAPALKWFAHIILPHPGRAITIVILIQSIFLLSIFAEIFVTTGGAFGSRTLAYLIFKRVLESQNNGLTNFFPILWTILTSFKTEGQAISDPPIFLFSDWTLENYAIVPERSN